MVLSDWTHKLIKQKEFKQISIQITTELSSVCFSPLSNNNSKPWGCQPEWKKETSQDMLNQNSEVDSSSGNELSTVTTMKKREMQEWQSQDALQKFKYFVVLSMLFHFSYQQKNKDFKLPFNGFQTVRLNCMVVSVPLTHP